MRRRSPFVCVAAVALVGSAGGCSRKTPAPTCELSDVATRCGERAPDGSRTCSVSARIATEYPLELLAVAEVTDDSRNLLRFVVPVDRRAVLERSDIKVRGEPGVRLVGVVLKPVHERFTVVDATTTCGPPGGERSAGAPCRTSGRVESSVHEVRVVVVEVRVPGEGWLERPARAWGIVRVENGRGDFAIDWSGPAAATSSPEVRAVGIVGNVPAQRT